MGHQPHPHRWLRRSTAWILAGLVLFSTASVGLVARAGTASAASARPNRPAAAGPKSIVQLGDSIASGEGTLYGFSFDTATGKWVGPKVPDPTWLPPYPDCHESKYAYGQVVAASFPRARFTQLGCTGATFDKGIAGAWSSSVPAEFGNWDTKANLNSRYTDAKPDLVLVTLGADDVQFVNVVTQCIKSNYDPFYRTTQCTAAEPKGPSDVIEKDFVDYLPTLEAHLKTLVGWIEARGKAEGAVPKIVFTTYANPLPSDAPAGGKNYCPDSWLFYNDQMDYLSSLVPELDSHIVDAIHSYVDKHHDKNIKVVNLSSAFDGHRWCAKDSAGHYIAPYAYGLSIYPHYTSLYDPNPAAFHPTPAGQKVIAKLVKPAVKQLFSGH